MAEDYETVDFDEWRQFDDRAADDRTVGPARKAETKGRCTNCWGPAAGLKDRDGHWVRMECRLCRRAVDAEDAQREAERMQLESEDNLPRARVGRGAVYHEGAQFVLKILPDMDRDKAQFEQRVAARREAEPKKNCLGRRHFPLGTAGSLYAQACAFVAGLNNLPREMSAISLSDFDFAEPQILGVEAPAADAPVRISVATPATHRKPSNVVMMARMGTAVVAGMVAAFACEVGMKAILMTRRDEAERTHDLLKLYKGLPEDSRKRLEADFGEIAGVLEKYRHTFDKWRYFEQRGGEHAIAPLVDTDRVWGLGKVARVIVDECVVAGLQYEIHVNADFEFTGDSDGVTSSEQLGLQVVGHEAAIPWDAVLAAGRAGRE